MKRTTTGPTVWILSVALACSRSGTSSSFCTSISQSIWRTSLLSLIFNRRLTQNVIELIFWDLDSIWIFWKVRFVIKSPSKTPTLWRAHHSFVSHTIRFCFIILLTTSKTCLKSSFDDFVIMIFILMCMCIKTATSAAKKKNKRFLWTIEILQRKTIYYGQPQSTRELERETQHFNMRNFIKFHKYIDLLLVLLLCEYIYLQHHHPLKREVKT